MLRPRKVPDAKGKKVIRHFGDVAGNFAGSRPKIFRQQDGFYFLIVYFGQVTPIGFLP